MRRCRSRPRCAPALLALCLAAAPLLAAPAPVPQIVVAGRGEVVVPPTHGRFAIAVTTSGPTAAAAGADNARLSKAVSEALAAAGMTPAELLGTRLAVNAKWDYDDHGRRKGRPGYEATNTLRIESTRLERLGLLIDAALGAGATSVSDVAFAAHDATAARRRALALAVEDARGEAEAIARAAGGTLGDLLLVTTEQSAMAPAGGEEMMVTAARRALAPPPPPTSVAPGDIVIDAQVAASWGFVPARR